MDIDDAGSEIEVAVGFGELFGERFFELLQRDGFVVGVFAVRIGFGIGVVHDLHADRIVMEGHHRGSRDRFGFDQVDDTVAIRVLFHRRGLRCFAGFGESMEVLQVHHVWGNPFDRDMDAQVVPRDRQHGFTRCLGSGYRRVQRR